MKTKNKIDGKRTRWFVIPLGALTVATGITGAIVAPIVVIHNKNNNDGATKNYSFKERQEQANDFARAVFQTRSEKELEDIIISTFEVEKSQLSQEGLSQLKLFLRNKKQSSQDIIAYGKKEDGTVIHDHKFMIPLTNADLSNRKASDPAMCDDNCLNKQYKDYVEEFEEIQSSSISGYITIEFDEKYELVGINFANLVGPTNDPH